MSAASNVLPYSPSPDEAIKPRFTLAHGFCLSLALHAGVLSAFFALPLLPNLIDKPEESLLVLDLNGFVGEDQAEEKIMQQRKGDAASEAKSAVEAAEPVGNKAAQTLVAPEASTNGAATSQAAQDASAARPSRMASPDVPVADEGSLPPPQSAQKATPEKAAAQKTGGAVQPKPQPAASGGGQTAGAAGSANVVGGDEEQSASTVQGDAEGKQNKLRDYIRILGKEVRHHLIYPNAPRQSGHHTAATVAFTILPMGQIRPESLRIVKSSGEPSLDACALATIRASLPLPPPPRELPITMEVAFDRRR
ncbi:TonB family protein [Beijerinckia mobilis]|uniref:TonB family protein n=1 Tax=Beijerinckia mobilis TaxID=231434 RepID=UPI000551BFA2|nr:TonB family protein [Beijerinckia mobilis]